MDMDFNVKFLWNPKRQEFVATPVDEDGRPLKGIPLDSVAERVKQIEQEPGMATFSEVIHNAKIE